MYMPGQSVMPVILAEFKELMLAVLNDLEIKAELSKQIRTEIDTRQPSYNGNRPTYEALTTGDVNMQLRMAASGYDVYGKTVISANSTFTNQGSYKKMKNQIKYGTSPQNRFRNKGSKNIT